MTEAGRHRLLQLLRGADQQSSNRSFPPPRRQSLAALAQAAQPEGPHDLGADHAIGHSLAPETAHPPSLAERSLRRQAPEVGAVCLNWARTVLCGGRPVMGVPTATPGSLAALGPRNDSGGLEPLISVTTATGPWALLRSCPYAALGRQSQRRARAQGPMLLI